MMSLTSTRALSMRSFSGRPSSTRTVGTPSTHFSSQGDRCFHNDSPMSSAMSVVITRKPLVIDRSSPSIAFWVASLMISSRMKSKVVIDASVRRPEIRTSTRRKPYTAAAQDRAHGVPFCSRVEVDRDAATGRRTG